MEQPQHPTERVEPLGESTLSDNAALTSIAISLKRIADALTGVGENAFSQSLNDYGENIGRCIQGQFERSQR